MRYVVRISRNNITLTVEEVSVEAGSVEEAKQKAIDGHFELLDIIEVTDVAELASEIESVEPSPE